MMDISMVWNVFKDLLLISGVPVVRSVSGWAVNALKDNKVTRFEWKQLVQTVVRVGTLGVMGYFGLSVVGVENAAMAAAIGSFFADKVFNALKNL